MRKIPGIDFRIYALKSAGVTEHVVVFLNDPMARPGYYAAIRLREGSGDSCECVHDEHTEVAYDGVLRSIDDLPVSYRKEVEREIKEYERIYRRLSYNMKVRNYL